MRLSAGEAECGGGATRPGFPDCALSDAAGHLFLAGGELHDDLPLLREVLSRLLYLLQP